MITAVDTNILLDILVPGQAYAEASEQSLAQALRSGPVIVAEPVYAELAGRFSASAELARFMEETGIRLQPSGAEVLYLAGRAWQDYLRRRTNALVCPACGTVHKFECTACGARFLPRQHVVADFVIGAHAITHANRLLSRDRAYYRTYFPDLVLS
ncbi:MAG: type II toxin-antitoxin system VapC family toxin [SAR202 cluster bacterium]|nr:type II toxin-antitoxin system VapC family toxin [SAR202 cluster bacterium]